MVFPIMPHRQDTIINKNFIFPSTFMRSSCNFPMFNCCNNFFGQMMKWQFGMSMIDMIFKQPQKQESFYPGLTLNSQQSQLQTQYNEYIAQQEQQQGLTAIQQFYGDRYRLGVIDGKLYAVTKDYSRQLSASSLTELMDVIKLDVAQHPEPVKPLEVEVDDNSDDDIDVDADNDDFVYEGNDDGNDDTESSFVKYTDLESSSDSNKYKKGMTIAEVLIISGLPATERNINLLTRKNPEALKEGKVDNLEKLVIPNPNSTVGRPVNWALQSWDGFNENTNATKELNNISNVDDIIDLMKQYGGKENYTIGEGTLDNKLKKDLIANNSHIFDKNGNVKEGVTHAQLQYMIVPYPRALVETYKFKVNLPEGWSKIGNRTYISTEAGARNKSLKVLVSEAVNKEDDRSDAEAMADAILQANGYDNFKNDEKQKFIKEIIRYNVSIMDDKGNLKEGKTIDDVVLPNRNAFKQLCTNTSNQECAVVYQGDSTTPTPPTTSTPTPASTRSISCRFGKTQR